MIERKELIRLLIQMGKGSPDPEIVTLAEAKKISIHDAFQLGYAEAIFRMETEIKTIVAEDKAKE